MVNRKSPARKNAAKSPRAQRSPVRSPNMYAKEVKIRRGPLAHAKLFDVGTKRKGLDGNMWKITMVHRKDGLSYKKWSRV